MNLKAEVLRLLPDMARTDNRLRFDCVGTQEAVSAFSSAGGTIYRLKVWRCQEKAVSLHPTKSTMRHERGRWE